MPNGCQEPLIVGVTGHRTVDIQSLELHRRELTGLLEELQKQCGERGLLVLSPLAEGTDQFVAELALDLGLRVECPLPLPLKLYEQDFEAGAALARFRELLRRASNVFAIPLPIDATVDELRRSGQVRDSAYVAVGRFVVDRSDVVLAAWDGDVNGKAGGTADTLAYALRQVREPPLRIRVIHVCRAPSS